MTSDAQPRVLSMGVAFPRVLMQKYNCRSTITSRMGGNRKFISLSGIKMMRQTMMTSAIKMVGV